MPTHEKMSSSQRDEGRGHLWGSRSMKVDLDPRGSFEGGDGFGSTGLSQGLAQVDVGERQIRTCSRGMGCEKLDALSQVVCALLRIAVAEGHASGQLEHRRAIIVGTRSLHCRVRSRQPELRSPVSGLEREKRSGQSFRVELHIRQPAPLRLPGGCHQRLQGARRVVGLEQTEATPVQKIGFHGARRQALQLALGCIETRSAGVSRGHGT